MGTTTRRYEITVDGELGAAVLRTLALFEPSIQNRAVTVLRGDVRDPAELNGVLQLLADLGIELIQVKQVPMASSRNG